MNPFPHSGPKPRPGPRAGAENTPAAWIDEDIGSACALVIDPSPAARQALTTMLREYGVGHVEPISRLDTARQVLQVRRFDIVLCEYHFAGELRTGMDFVEDLRLGQALSMSTVFIIVSSEAEHSRVAEVAEAALDGYLLKPHSTQNLLDRLHAARARKAALADIIKATESGQLVHAIQLCKKHVIARGTDWLAAARIAAELHLKLGQTLPAQALFDNIVAAGTLPWAKLGLARTQYQAGDLGRSRRTLESLLSEQPGYSDAYDALGRVLVDQCDFGQALATFRRSCELTPGSSGRLQKFGLLAFLQGGAEEATRALEKANALGQGAATFDYQTLMLLALLYFDKGDARALQRTQVQMARAAAQHATSPRLRRLQATIEVLCCLLERRVPEGVLLLRGLLAETRAPDFDLEAACNLLTVLSRMQSDELRLDDAAHQIDQLAQRFAVSKATAEMMCGMARPHPAFETLIRSAYENTCKVAETAVSHTVGGAPKAAVQALLMQIERTLNSKLMDLAEHTLQRHRAAIAGCELLESQLRRWRERFASYGTQVRAGAFASFASSVSARPPAPSGTAAAAIACPAAA